MLLAGCNSTQSESQSPPERATLRQAPAVQTSYVAIIGDSYTAGSAMGGRGQQSWPAIAVAQLRESGVNVTPITGAAAVAGYISRGHNQAGTFADQVGKVVGANDQLVILFGSRNDELAPAEQLESAVRHTLSEAKLKAPKAKFLVISPIWAKGDPSPGILQSRDILRSEAESIGATFVDTIADRWFMDRPDLIGSDGQHPTDDGHRYMAQNIAPIIAELLPPPPPAASTSATPGS